MKSISVFFYIKFEQKYCHDRDIINCLRVVPEGAEGWWREAPWFAWRSYWRFLRTPRPPPTYTPDRPLSTVASWGHTTQPHDAYQTHTSFPVLYICNVHTHKAIFIGIFYIYSSAAKSRYNFSTAKDTLTCYWRRPWWASRCCRQCRNSVAGTFDDRCGNCVGPPLWPSSLSSAER